MIKAKTLNQIPVAQRTIENVIAELVGKNYDALSGNYGLTGEDVNYMRNAIEEYGRTLVKIPTDDLEKSEGVFVLSRSNDVIECWHFDVDLWTREEGLSDLSITTYIYVEGNKAWLQFQDLHIL